MKTFFFYVCWSIGVATVMVVMISLIILGNRLVDPTTPRLYNCSIAEISPDFTNAMREECRKLRKTTT
jgi:hypothetical protein